MSEQEWRLRADLPAATVADFEARAQRHETPIDDEQLVWRSWGSGPPLILLHGVQGAWFHWIRNIDALATARTLFALDLPGHGDSGLPVEYTHESISRALATGLEALVGEASVDILGFSFGGILGGQFAARYPDKVRRIIVTASGGLGTPFVVPELKRVRGLEGAQRQEALRHNLLTLMLHYPQSVDALAMYLLTKCGFRGPKVGSKLALPHQLLDAIERVTCQVDLVWGELDQLHFDPAAQLAAVRRVKPDVEMQVVPDAGHWVMYERAEAFNRIVLEMLAAPLR